MLLRLILLNPVFLFSLLFLLFLFILYCRSLWKEHLRKENALLRKYLSALQEETRRKDCLPFEEDLSEETSEVRGLPCSAVMDEEDEEYS